MEQANNKVFKPKSCLECPVFKRERKNSWCGVRPTSHRRGEKQPQHTLNEMYNTCPIEWDKSEGLKGEIECQSDQKIKIDTRQIGNKSDKTY